MATAVAVVSIVVACLSAGVTIHSVTLNNLNQTVRSAVQNMYSAINKEIAAGRLSASKLVSLLQSKNNQAMMSYVYSNPVISRTLDDINKDASKIMEYQSELQALEQEILSYQNELGSLGYSQSHSGVRTEKKKASEIRGRIDDAQQRYNRKVAEMERSNIGSIAEPTNPKTSDLDAASQNVKGGIL